MKLTQLILCAVLLTAYLFGAGSVLAEEVAHKPITQQLMSLLEAQPDVKAMLTSSIAKAKAINPDAKTNPVQSLEDYLTFIDQSSELIPQEVVANPAKLTQEQILQTICYFYFLIDQPLDELKGKDQFSNTLQYYPPFSEWAHDYVKAWGSFLDTEASWNEKVYQEFYTDPRFGLQNSWYEPSANWNTFNRFFSRYLASPDMRPIASPADASVVVAPADSVPQGVWPIDAQSRITVNDGLHIKLSRFFTIPELLGADSEFANAFAGGVLTHSFLNVNDYHRYHFAIGGTVKEVKNILKNVAIEVSWSPTLGRYLPIDSTGWQFSQTRGVAIVDTGDTGLVALIPMGMAQVSSVNFEDTVKVGAEVAKGDMLGTFLFGGSDFVMLFQKEAGFKLTAPMNKQITTQPGADHGSEVGTYDHVLMGEEYGVMKGSANH
jgi:phosphatidylserine decarboxylase